jgi:hypothetical protein
MEEDLTRGDGDGVDDFGIRGRNAADVGWEINYQALAECDPEVLRRSLAAQHRWYNAGCESRS